MKNKLTKILAELAACAARAEIFAGSDNETTAERYGEVESDLNDAISAIESAIDSLSDR